VGGPVVSGRPTSPARRPRKRPEASDPRSAPPVAAAASKQPRGRSRPRAVRHTVPATPVAEQPSGKTRAGVLSRHTVSSTSVRRFAERARRRRRLTLRNALWLGAGVAVVLLAAWVALFSPLLTVRTIDVTGTERLPVGVVKNLADGAKGVPLSRVDVSQVSEEVLALPGVRDATVQRAWPSTLRIQVVERKPLAAVPTEQGFQLVDGEGVVLDTVAKPPEGIPQVSVDVASAGSQTVREVAAVLQALPGDLRSQVSGAGATSRDSVTLKLTSGATVVWGSADDSPRKVKILQALLETDAKVYDVSAPELPVTR
jgi:cell division protein FtsQ